MPIPDLSNKPGPGRPGWATGAYEFQFEVDGQVTIKAHAASGGGSFTIKWPNGSSQSFSGNNGTIVAPDATAGIVAINNKLDTGYCDEFAVTGGKDKVKKVISWGERPWKKLAFAFSTCSNLTNIENTKLIGAANCNIEYLFYNCAGLTEALCENWDLSLGCEMRYLFQNCTNLELLNLTGSKLPGSSTAASNYSFNLVGSNTTNGCEFKMSGLDFTGTSNAPGRQWFQSAKFKDGSNLSNWNFDSALNSFYATDLFAAATVNGTLDVSGWNWPNQQFPSFNSVNSSLTSQNGSKIKLTNFDVSKVNNFASAFGSCKVYELEGLSTWGACAGNASIYRMFSGATLMRINPNDNFSNTFVASLTPTYVHEAFNLFGNGLQDSEFGVCPNLNGLDLSNLLSSDTIGLSSFMRGHRSTNTPDFSNVTFSSTNTVGFANAFREFRTIGTGSNSIFNFNPTTVKPANFQSTWYFAQGLTEVNIGSNVDMSSMTSVSGMLYAINYNASATPFTNATFPTNADFSSLTVFGTWVAFSGQVLSTCQVDNFFRRLRATNDNSNVTVDFYSCKVTGAPSVVRSDVDYFTNTKGWNIQLASPDVALPFQYSSYHIEPTETSITPTVLPPLADRNFSSTNTNMPVDQLTGVITQSSGYVGSTTIRCTYANGCYNEVNIVSDYPMKFTIDTSHGTANDLLMKLPFYVTGQVTDDIAISWGDNGYQTIDNSTQTITHTYGSAGDYQIRIWGQGYVFPVNRFYGYLKLKSFDAWGSYIWCSNRGNLSGTGGQTDPLHRFQIPGPDGAGNTFDYAATDAPTFTGTDNRIRYMFDGFYNTKTGSSAGSSTAWTFSGNVSNWDISKVIDLQGLFGYQNTVNILVSGKGFDQWDTRNVTSMYGMFALYGGHGCDTLEQFQNWRTDSLENLVSFGSYAWFGSSCGSKEYLNTKVVNEGTANEYIAWDVSNVTNFAYMLYGSNRANLNIDKWQINTTVDVSFNQFTGGANTQWSLNATSPGNAGSCANRVVANGVKTRSVTLGTTNPVTYTAWDVQKVTALSSFNTNWGGNSTYTYYLDADVSGWNLTNLKKMNQVFANNGNQYGRQGQTILPASADFSNIDAGETVTWLYNRGSSCEDGTVLLDFFYSQHANITSYTNSNVNINLNYKFATASTTSKYTGNNAVIGAATVNGSSTNLVAGGSPFTSSMVGGIVTLTSGTNSGQQAKITTFNSASSVTISPGINLQTEQNTFTVDTTNPAKGRFNMVNAGYNVIDGGKIVPFNPFKIQVRVPNGGLNFSFAKIMSPSNVNATINWGDGQSSTISAVNSIPTHTYTNSTGSDVIYEIELNQGSDSAYCTGFRFDDNLDATSRAAVENITQWGSTSWVSMASAFKTCSNLDVTATDGPVITSNTNLTHSFGSCTSLVNSNGSIGNWDVSQLTALYVTFDGCTSFNVDISKWDTSSVGNMNNTFLNCTSFNQDLSTKYITAGNSPTGSAYWAWNTSSVSNMGSVFKGATSFNCGSNANGLSNWNTSSATTMYEMFENSGYNKPLNTNLVPAASSYSGSDYVAWDVDNVTDFREMFRDNTSFNQDIGKWKFKSTGTIAFNYMLKGATAFAQDISTKTITAGNSPYGTQYTAWDISRASSLTRVIAGTNVNVFLNWNVGQWSTYALHSWGGASAAGGLSVANYTDQIVKWANDVNAAGKSPTGIYAVINSDGATVPNYDSTRTYGSGFANAGRARSYLSLDVSVSGLSGFNGTYYYDYATGQYINESDSTLKFVYNTDESVWELQDEEGAQHSGSGGSQANGPTSATWSGFTVSDASAGWTFNGTVTT